MLMTTQEQELAIVGEAIQKISTAIQGDGGELKLLGFRNDIARVQMGGACASCQMAGQTLGGIRRHLTEAMGRPIRVVPAWMD
jgi:NifU-like protein